MSLKLVCFVAEKFDNSLKDLQQTTANENEFSLNPRLSISARFLSRCQKNSRFVLHCPKRFNCLKSYVLLQALGYILAVIHFEG